MHRRLSTDGHGQTRPRAIFPASGGVSAPWRRPAAGITLDGQAPPRPEDQRCGKPWQPPPRRSGPPAHPRGRPSGRTRAVPTRHKSVCAWWRRWTGQKLWPDEAITDRYHVYLHPGRGTRCATTTARWRRWRPRRCRAARRSSEAAATARSGRGGWPMASRVGEPLRLPVSVRAVAVDGNVIVTAARASIAHSVVLLQPRR